MSSVNKMPMRLVVVLIGTSLYAVYLLRLMTPAMPASGLVASRLTAEPTWPIYLPLIIGDQRDPPPNRQATWGAPIAISPRDGTVWVVNPDADSITAVDPERLITIREISIGQEPWSLAFTPDGTTLLVVNRAGGELAIVDPARFSVQSRLPVGPEPGQIAVSPHGDRAYVTVTATSTLAVIDLLTLTVIQQVPLPPHPYAVAVSADSDRVYVTHFLAQAVGDSAMRTNDGATGQVSVLDARGEPLDTISLPSDVHGFANQLAGITLHGKRAWVPVIRASPALPNNLSTTVFAAVSSLNLTTGRDEAPARLNLNDEVIFGSPVNNPVAAVPAPDGQMLYVVLAGSDLVEVVDVADPLQPRLEGFIPAGRNPRGIAISPDGRRGYVLSYLSRAVTVLDLPRMRPIATIPVTAETLDPDVLRGKILFNTATDPRMTRSSWISCASCHADGGTDGITWAMVDGPRQTPALWNAGATLPWHWSAALDELQDVEDSIHSIQFGLGLAPGVDPPLLGAPNAGRSADLDALAAFLDRGIRPPRVAPPMGDSARGRQIFVAAGCASCHGGPNWTISALPGPPGTLDPDGNGMIDIVLRDVGTATADDVRGATGFDVPTLLGVGLTAPYFHDGSMPTLEALLASGHPDPGRTGPGLSPTELAALVAFIRAIGPDTETVEAR